MTWDRQVAALFWFLLLFRSRVEWVAGPWSLLPPSPHEIPSVFHRLDVSDSQIHISTPLLTPSFWSVYLTASYLTISQAPQTHQVWNKTHHFPPLTCFSHCVSVSVNATVPSAVPVSILGGALDVLLTVASNITYPTLKIQPLRNGLSLPFFPTETAFITSHGSLELLPSRPLLRVCPSLQSSLASINTQREIWSGLLLVYGASTVPH